MSQRPGARRVQVGDVLEVLDGHYCYGSGLLLLRVTEVGEGWQRDNEFWQELRGIQLHEDGSTPPAALPRYVIVRLSGARLRRAVQPVDTPR